MFVKPQPRPVLGVAVVSGRRAVTLRLSLRRLALDRRRAQPAAAELSPSDVAGLARRVEARGAHASDIALAARAVARLTPAAARPQALREAEAAASRRTASAWRTGAPRSPPRVVANLSGWGRKCRLAGDLLCVGTFSGDVHVVELSSGRTRHVLRPGVASEVTALAFDGATLAVGGARGGVAVYDATNGFAGGLLGGEGGSGSGSGGSGNGAPSCRVVALSLPEPSAHGGAVVVSVSADGLVRTHGLLHPSGDASFYAGGAVSSAAFDGRYTALGMADGRLVLLAGGLGHDTSPSYAFSSDGRAGGAAGGVAATAPPRRLLSFAAHAGGVTAVQLVRHEGGDAGGGSLITGGGDGIVRVFPLGADCTAPPFSAASSSSSSSPSSRNDAKSGGLSVRGGFSAHEGAVTCLYADASKLVTGGCDGAVRVWGVDGAPRFTLSGYTAYLDDLQVDGATLVATGTNNLVIAMNFG